MRLKTLKIGLETDKGQYGIFLEFAAGLNVIRANNTSGKSTIITIILYCLGLEILTGWKGIKAINPVLKEFGDYDGVEFKVKESYAEIEIQNDTKETIFIRRYIKGEKDSNLVEVFRGPDENPQAFFVGVPGAAAREKGFHHFLSRFLGLQLPEVARYQGNNVPLYMECIAPLLFIEQKRGWAKIQATLPSVFKIVNVGKVTVEYILDLDVIENEKKRKEIDSEASQLKSSWRSLYDLAKSISSHIAGSIVDLSKSPISDFDGFFEVEISEHRIYLKEYLLQKRHELQSMSDTKILTDNPELTELLDQKATEAILLEARVSQSRIDLQNLEFEYDKLSNRLIQLQQEIQRNKDLKRLQQYGAELNVTVATDQCPTCSQSIHDLGVDVASLLSFDETVGFLQAESEAIKVLLAAEETKRNIVSAQKHDRARQLENLKSEIRDLKRTLVGEQNPSIAQLRKQVQLEEFVKQLESAVERLSEIGEELKVLSKKWKRNRQKFGKLPLDYFSELDYQKLNLLEQKFRKALSDFEYDSSKDISKIYIRKDNYQPESDEFTLSTGISASDNIRIIWAFTTALMETTSEAGGNHWGICVMDEPEQQQIAKTSSIELFKKLAKLGDEFQSIIATSAPVDAFVESLAEVDYYLIDFDGKMIKPIS